MIFSTLNDSLYVGSIFSYNADKSIGEVHLLGDIHNSDISGWKGLCCFSISDCSTPINLHKLIVCNRYFDKFTNRFKANSIEAFNPSVHSSLSPFILKVLDYSDLLLPEYNPLLFQYFLENNKIHRSIENPLSQIKKHDEKLASFPCFSKDLAIEGYSVIIDEKKNYRPGKDDAASISKCAYNKYALNDNYVQKFLPCYNKMLARDSYWSPANHILDSLWEDLGGDIFKKQIEEECIHEKGIAINNFSKEYNSNDHLAFLVSENRALKRNFLGQIETKNRELRVFF